MRYSPMVGLACIAVAVWLAMPPPSFASTSKESLAEEIARAPLGSALREALEERQRFLNGLEQARPAPMRTPSQATTHRAAGPGRLVRLDLATGNTTTVRAAIPGLAGPVRMPGSQGLTLPGLGRDGGDKAPGGIRAAGGCTAPSTDLSTHGFPWRTVFKMLMRFNVGGTDFFYVCSAASVHPFHLITAGHCLYNWDPNDDGNESDAAWADEVWVWPGQTDLVDPFGCVSGCPVEEDYPYGVAKAVALYSYEGWTVDEDFDHDMAYIALDRRLGDRVGWMGAEAGFETSALNFDGYPTETPFVPACTNGPYPGFDADNVEGYSTFRIELCAFIYGGHSGGPEWRFDGTDRYIQGVNSTSDRMGSAEGTRLTVGKFDDLYDDIIPDDTADIPPVDRPELIEYVLDLDAKDLLTNSVCKGNTFQIEYNAYNVGFASSGAVTLDFYLSTNDCISNTDVLVGSLALGSLNANTFYNATTTLTAPCNLANGTYYAGWIMNCATAEYGTGDNAVIISDETITLTQTGPPSFTVSASGGNVNASCVFLAPYSTTITDDCGVDVSSIQVSATSLDGLATVGTPTVNINVVSPTEVEVSGQVAVSALTGCPADVRITVEAEDLCGLSTTRSRDIQVNDTIAPTITVALSQTSLWPPNHKLVTINATVVAADNCPNTTWTLQSITSDEPENGLGDGDAAPDIVDAALGTADIEFKLRAERAGGGDGRVYTIVYGVSDACGNSSQAVAHVEVPHDRGGGASMAMGNDGPMLIVYGRPQEPASEVDPSTVWVGTNDFIQVQAQGSPHLADLDSDGIEDAAFGFGALSPDAILEAIEAGLPAYARWERSGAGYLALMTMLVPGIGNDWPTVGRLAPTRDEPLPTEVAAFVRPNPSRGAANVMFALPTAGRVRLTVWDIAGREVARLADGEWPAGLHTVRFEPIAGQSSAQVYLYRLEALGRTLRGRFVLLR